MKKIAILGVTGYIGSSLLQEFFEQDKGHSLYLFSRSHEKVRSTIKHTPKKTSFEVLPLDEFAVHTYDLVINCASARDPIQKGGSYEIFKVTEDIDALVLPYLHKYPKTTYVTMSSGAAYGDVYTDGPVTKKTQAVLPQKDNPEYCYIISKINTEAKHRTLSKLNIIDLRVYAFFSSMVDVSTPFLMSEIVSSILHKKVFETSSQEMVRDYSSGATLYALIMAIMKRPCNGAFDVYSTKPVSKKDLLVALSKKFGLEYREHTVKSTTKQKPSKKYYYSLNKNLDAAFGYKPTMSSLEIITHELQKRLTWF